VSFGTLTDEPTCEVFVHISNTVEPRSKAKRAIVVPFEVGSDGIEIVSIADGKAIDIDEGTYELVFSAIPSSENNGIDMYEFAFVKSENPQARILIADVELNPPEELLMVAKSAI